MNKVQAPNGRIVPSGARQAQFITVFHEITSCKEGHKKKPNKT
jgi:hypothetical protein